jgi:hypothetical protein
VKSAHQLRVKALDLRVPKDEDLRLLKLRKTHRLVWRPFENDHHLCPAGRRLGAELYAVPTSQRQRTKNESETNLAGIIRHAENPQIGMASWNEMIGQQFSEPHLSSTSRFVSSRVSWCKNGHKNKKPTSRLPLGGG